MNKKKILAVFIMISFCLLPVFSDVDLSGKYGTGSTNELNERASLLVVLQESDMVEDSVIIGFLNKAIADFAFDTVIKENDIRKDVTLADLNNSGFASNSGVENDVFVFYQVDSKSALTISVGLDNVLVAENNNRLGWQLSWETISGDTEFATGNIDYPEGADNLAETVKPIYKHDPLIGRNASGIKQLTIATDSYRNKAVDTYQGYVFVSVVNGG